MLADDENPVGRQVGVARNGAARRAFLARTGFGRVALVVALLAALVAFLAGAPGALAQEDPDPAPQAEEPVASTTAPLIDPGAGAETDAAPSASDQASRRVQYVSIGLIVLAVLVMVVTVVFFRRTRPSEVAANEAAKVGARVRTVTRPAPEQSPGSGVSG